MSKRGYRDYFLEAHNNFSSTLRKNSKESKRRDNNELSSKESIKKIIEMDKAKATSVKKDVKKEIKKDEEVKFANWAYDYKR